MRDRDEDYGLPPREWLDSDPVPLTPDIDLNDPEQRIAWIRANNEENYQRGLELQARRAGPPAEVAAKPGGRGGTTTVVAVRVQNVEHRALVRLARREGVTVSDLLRRWARSGLDAANGTGVVEDPQYPEPEGDRDGDADERATERAALRRAVEEAADAAVERITDELRRWREIVVASG